MAPIDICWSADIVFLLRKSPLCQCNFLVKRSTLGKNRCYRSVLIGQQILLASRAAHICHNCILKWSTVGRTRCFHWYSLSETFSDDNFRVIPTLTSSAFNNPSYLFIYLFISIDWSICVVPPIKNPIQRTSKRVIPG